MGLGIKHLLDLRSLQKEQIEEILDTAVIFKKYFSSSREKLDFLKNVSVTNLFFEPSTRTRMSFEIAAKRLGADVVNVSVSTSSIVKGETLLDTIKTILSMNVDLIVMRHSSSGAPHFLSQRVNASFVNAGDGYHSHPTQGLLDIFTMKEKLGKIKGLNVTIIGDITHSRVARSNIWGLKKLGANVRVAGPSTLIPKDLEALGVKVFYDVDEALDDTDVVNILRIQLERQKETLLPSLREYNRLYGVDEKRPVFTKRKILVMHPGPMNRGVEISDSIADSEMAVINEQVTNGIAVRMAVLYLLKGNGNLNKLKEELQ